MEAGKQRNLCQMSSFQESQKGYLLSTEDGHDFMNLENMKMVQNSCNGDASGLGNFNHSLGLSCPVSGTNAALRGL